MTFLDEQPLRDRAAIGMSIALHLCAFVGLAVVARSTLFSLGEARENAPVLAYTTLTHRARVVPPRITLRMPHAQPRPTVRVALAPVSRPRAAAVPSARVAPRSATARSAVQPTSKARALPPPALRPAALAVIAVARPTVAPAPDPTPAASPTPGPASTQGPTASFAGLFSENYPPTPSPPDAIVPIRDRMSGHYDIRVRVDETGRAIDVVFVTPVADPALANDIRARLLALTYVPADCNGLHCDGTLEIVR